MDGVDTPTELPLSYPKQQDKMGTNAFNFAYLFFWGKFLPFPSTMGNTLDLWGEEKLLEPHQ